jgi:hypothetical protein
VTYAARVLYAGLWCYSDDFGRGQYLPKAIEGAVFPHDAVDIVNLLMRLEQAGLIRVYESKGDVFYEIPKWNDYQSPRYKAKTNVPEPSEGQYRESPIDMHPGLFGTEFPQSQNGMTPGFASGEGVGEGEGVVARSYPQSEEFTVFNANRAAAELRKRGKQVDNFSGYAKTIAEDPVFRTHSAKLWAHRECQRCAGKGTYNSDYAPGAGIRSIDCEEPQ